jgi:hypothetical protein
MKDHRRNNNAGDIKQRYNNFKDYTSTSFAKDIERTVGLIPEDGDEVTVKDLRSALTTRGYVKRLCRQSDKRSRQQ